MKTPSAPNVFVAEFTAETLDNLGLVYELTRVFAAHNLNISMIDTEQTIAPFGGTTLFSMNGTITSEQPTDITQLKSDIKELEHRIRIDVTLRVTMTSQS
jgi:glycine cleavage system regulatory protein